MRALPIARLTLLLVLAGLPFAQSNAYWVHVFSLALISVILAFSQQLLVGSAGIVSLGQGAFFGVGAYTAASLSISADVPFLLTIAAGGLAAGLSSLLLIPIVRLKGSSLAVATLGFAIIIHLIMLNEDWLTGGSIGMMDIPAPTLFGFSLGGEVRFYYVCLIAVALVFLALDRITHSRFGRALTAMSQDEEAARASGVAISVYKSKCFLIAAIVSGIAGGLYAYHSRYLNPNDFDFQKSIDILIMVVIGGIRSLSGAALGAVIVVLVPEVLRSSGEFRLLLFGVMVIVLAGTGSRGLSGILIDLAKRISSFRPGAGSPQKPSAVKL
ncbi:branched-chain amino acid ABC transporter permease [Bradyrhizobium erythrophlei]|uniref:Amino acid/amide ABC transporter membrane protein 2, HAAT family n=1 Tax=Bradyrhizobium erythrophlei TaxID=1437360 RepID=A0A1M7UUQ1_9BRAD|nr:branched-chain amino acid ABC transporter permease [Bradyrhizobium erythrophlei]SHN86689.1 amino acid/amide ABC transporter membrane protein 2, HAAT family [Bradyrhizobium erythrophlei]